MKSGTKPSWSNWSGSVHCRPEGICYPESVEDVRSIVEQCRSEGRRLRVVGSGHSFTPLVQTDDLLVSLERLRGLVHVDHPNRTVTVWAGTKLKDLGEWLQKHGLSQENLGDINAQSVAGAISTGTHGTGIRFGNLSTQVESLTLVTASGDLLTCSAEQHPDRFKAALVSLGALGIMVQVKLRVLPGYRIHYRSRRMPLTECLQHLQQHREEHRHFEFFWFPYSETVQAKFMDETDLPPTRNHWWSSFNQTVVENGLFWLLSEAVRRFPVLSRSVSRLSARGVPVLEQVGDSHQLFASPRWVRFQEMEYAVSAESLIPVLEEIRGCIERNRFHVHFPIECRYVKKDDIWLSPAYGRDSAFIAVHMYKGMPHQAYFSAVEDIFRRHGGRPHWGKMHSLRGNRLRELYPKWDAFLKVREELDPDGMFLNPYLTELFGLESQKNRSSAAGM